MNENVLRNMIEVDLVDNSFLNLRETLNRIGDLVEDGKTLKPVCHILQKKGKYYICHYNEMFAMDSHDNIMTKDDTKTRNRIALLVEQWGLVIIKEKDKIVNLVGSVKDFTVLKYKEREGVSVEPYYVFGQKM